MAEEHTYLYHCDRCGSLFKSKQHAKQDIRCSTCGEHPVKPKYTAVNKKHVSEKYHQKDTHGVPDKDEADIFSMQKKRKRRNWATICLMWVFCLGVLAFVAYRMNNKAKNANKANMELGEEDSAYLAKKNDALEKCTVRFIQFATESIISSKSSHLLNGSDLILDLNRYYGSNMMKHDLAKSKIIQYELDESGKHTKFKALYKYQPEADQENSGYEFEVLFWKTGEDWFIDWPYFVRLGEMSWFRFREDKKIGLSNRFKLYARELNTESIILSGYEEYKFSEAYNNSTVLSQLSTSVYVQHQTSMKTMLTKKFQEYQELSKSKANKNNGVRFVDPPNSIRLDVTLDFEEIEGETVMVLKEIHNLDWETPPAAEN
jgi:DNA-directed RNA polymerase subunit RPC12/RpoP/cbb3-type cytochrome oxidase subunit 3